MEIVYNHLREMEWERFVLGVTISPLSWRLQFSIKDAHVWCQIGPIAIDIGWGG